MITMRYEQDHQIGILFIEEDITIKNVNQFKERMETFIHQSEQQFILDLTKVKYLNSSALGVIANTVMQAKEQEKEFILSGVTPPIDEIFDIVKFSSFVKMYTTIAEARNYYNP